MGRNSTTVALLLQSTNVYKRQRRRRPERRLRRRVLLRRLRRRRPERRLRRLVVEPLRRVDLRPLRFRQSTLASLLIEPLVFLAPRVHFFLQPFNLLAHFREAFNAVLAERHTSLQIHDRALEELLMRCILDPINLAIRETTLRQ